MLLLKILSDRMEPWRPNQPGLGSGTQKKAGPYQHPAFGTPSFRQNYGPPPKNMQTGLPIGQQDPDCLNSDDVVSGGNTGRPAHSGFRDAV
ncbi:unnamed protein product [Allacma fusca]|uniref:Uncharacterized protein n=1 Tax=Allacma fusca TaxID=39272 RepID=A0A8J2JLF1_9HEXA|nr:unnamed protein product [Allacma fusca]